MGQESTIVDHYILQCPHCGGKNHYYTREAKINLNKTDEFNKPCSHCGETVYYQVRCELVVSAHPVSQIRA